VSGRLRRSFPRPRHLCSPLLHLKPPAFAPFPMADANTAPAAPAMSAAGSAALPSALSAASSAAAAVPAAQAQATRRFASGAGHDPSTTTTFGYAADDDDDDSVRTDRPDELTMNEITMMLKVKTSSLALGACERVRRIARSFPVEVCADAHVVPGVVELAAAAEPGALTAAALGALAMLAAVPQGRQRVAAAGAIPPAIRILLRMDMKDQSTQKAVLLLVNLSVDAQCRKKIRDAGGVESLVSAARVAPMDCMMEYVLGAIHNLICADIKARDRAVDAGIALGIVRVLSERLPETHVLSVRARALVSDLLQVPDIQGRLDDAAAEMGVTAAQRECGRIRTCSTARGLA